MCGFAFTVFLSAFQLLPTAPFRIIALGGSEGVAGLFVGLLTYASAASALVTGALADRWGKRRMLMVCSLVVASISFAYASIASVTLMLVLVAVHGLFWSGLLTSTGAYLGDIIPPARRAEGMGYYGAFTVLAIAAGPALGLSIYRFGWVPVCVSAGVMNLVMALIAWKLPESEPPGHVPAPFVLRKAIGWRVFALSIPLFLYYFGYGGITSFAALYATANGVTPPGIYFTVFAVSALTTTFVAGPLGDRFGHARLIVPLLAMIAVAYALLAVAGSLPWLVVSGAIFGAAFRAAYQLFAAHVLHLVEPSRRGAAFGSIITALDTGVGTGSIAMGWVIEHHGFRPAFAMGAILAAIAVPYFVVVNGVLERRAAGGRSGGLEPVP